MDKEILKAIASSIRESSDYQEAQHDDEIMVIGVELDIYDAEDFLDMIEGGE